MTIKVHQNIELVDSSNSLTLNKNGDISTDVNDLDLSASAGDVTVTANTNVTIEATTGDIDLDASAGTSPAINITAAGGGAITIKTDDEASPGGGFLKLETGDNSNTANCDYISILGGSNSNGSSGNGAGITILAGASAAGSPGAVSVRGGNGTSAGISGGNVTVAAGTSGAGADADVVLAASNAGAATTYIRCDGSAEKVDMIKGLLCSSTAEFDGQVDFDADVDINSTASVISGGSLTVDSGGTLTLSDGATATCSTTLTVDADGRLVLTEKTLEGSPSQGELCQDTLHDTLAYYNGSIWQNAAPLVYRMISQSDALGLGDATEGQFQKSSVDLEYDIPANSLRAGNIIRVRACFGIDKGGSNTDIDIRFFIGPNGGGSGSDTVIGGFAVTGATGDRTYFVDADIMVRSIGGSGVVLPAGSCVGDSEYSSFTKGGYGITETVDTTALNHVYFSGELSSAASNSLYMESFSVEII